VDAPWLDEPFPQPSRFTVRSLPRRGPVARAPARILAIEVLDRSDLPVRDLCRGLRDTAPAVAGKAFTPRCEPIYTTRAAAALAEFLDDPFGV
jgi:hypothetical protein